ncbi:26292_t:CDS:2, partial [Gigaspora margarita]
VRRKQATAGSLDTEPRELEWKKGPSSFWLLEEPGPSGSHKHSRTESGKACTRKVEPHTGSDNTDPERQHDHSFIYQQIGWNGITPNESTSERDLDNMPTQTGAPNSRTYTRASECNSRSGFTHENRPTRLDDQQRNIRSDSASVGATEPGCIRQPHKSFNPSIHIMENRSRSDCYQFSPCAMEGLEYLGQPSMDSITQGAGQ